MGRAVAALTGQVLNARAIPTPGWRKLNDDESDQSCASTYGGDGKMGRSIYVPRGRYAMGALISRTEMSAFLTPWGDVGETESEDSSGTVSDLTIYL